MRIGQGIDIHAFGPGDHVVLAGVHIPHERGVIAHSDGDVVIHALCDALLGALALGDIGHHFPPTDARWKDVSSRHFLLHCSGLMIEQGYALANADISVVCETPKLAPYVDAMRRNLAADLGCAIGAISIKATTSETLGFTGRGEGIAAFVVVLLEPRHRAPVLSSENDPELIAEISRIATQVETNE